MLERGCLAVSSQTCTAVRLRPDLHGKTSAYSEAGLTAPHGERQLDRGVDGLITGLTLHQACGQSLCAGHFMSYLIGLGCLLDGQHEPKQALHRVAALLQRHMGLSCCFEQGIQVLQLHGSPCQVLALWDGLLYAVQQGIQHGIDALFEGGGSCPACCASHCVV